jgi:PelA/Pel-15E family pectate lyase
MTITNPSPAIIRSIEGGLAWLETVKITGLTKTKRDGKTVYESNPTSTQVYWARFYDLTNNKPIFPGRDRVIYDSYEAMAAANKVGYDYFTTKPHSILNTGQKKWRKMVASRSEK